MRPATLDMLVAELSDSSLTIAVLRRWIRQGKLAPIGRARVGVGQPKITYDADQAWSIYNDWKGAQLAKAARK